jgi:hypothetical protein
LSPIRNNNLKTALACGKRRRESGWAAPDYEDVGF